MSDDLHSPTTAAPEPTPAAGAAGPEPTPVVGAQHATTEHPAGTAADGFALPGPLANLPIEEHPEILVGAAFAGGVIAAFILKRLGR